MNRRVSEIDVDARPDTERSRNWPRRWLNRVPAGTAGVLLLIAWALGHLKDPGLWVDEVFSARFAVQPLDVVLKDLWSSEANMGPYYLLLHFWAPLLPASEAWLRTPSVIGAAVAVWALSELVRRWTSSYALAIVSGVMLALIPAFRYSAVDARAYSWSIALVVVATLAITRSTDGSVQLRAGTYGAVMGLAVSLNLVAAAAFAVPAALITLANNRLKWLASLAGTASISAVVFAPFAHAYWLNRVSQASWIPSLTIRGFVANGFGDGLEVPLSFSWAALTIVFVISAATALVLAAFHPDGRRSPLSVENPADRVFLVIAGVGTLAPPILLGVASELIQPLMQPQFLSFTTPFAVASAIGLAYCAFRRMSSHRAVNVVLASLLLVVVTVLSLVRMPWSTERRVDDDFRSAAAFLESSATRTDSIVFENFVIYGFAWYGFLENRQVFGARHNPEDAPLEGFDVIPLERFEAGADQVVWWVTLPDPTVPPPTYLAVKHASLRNCRAESETHFGRIVVQRYSPVDSC